MAFGSPAGSDDLQEPPDPPASSDDHQLARTDGLPTAPGSHKNPSITRDPTSQGSSTTTHMEPSRGESHQGRDYQSRTFRGLSLIGNPFVHQVVLPFQMEPILYWFFNPPGFSPLPPWRKLLFSSSHVLQATHSWQTKDPVLRSIAVGE